MGVAVPGITRASLERLCRKAAALKVISAPHAAALLEAAPKGRGLVKRGQIWVYLCFGGGGGGSGSDQVHYFPHGCILIYCVPCKPTQKPEIIIPLFGGAHLPVASREKIYGWPIF